MKNQFKKIVGILAIVAWLFLPALVVGPLILWTYAIVSFFRLEPISFILVTFAVLQCAVVTIFRSRQKTTKSIFGIILLGWLIQIISLFVVWSIAADPKLIVTSYALWIVASLVGLQITASLVYLALLFVARKVRSQFFHRPIVPLVGIVAIAVCALAAINIVASINIKAIKTGLDSNDSGYDLSDISFRADQKNTLLGNLPRPLRIFNTPSGYVGVTLTGEHISLSFLNAIGNSKIDYLFLDVFDDRVYFVRDRVGYVYDLTAKTTTKLPETIQAVLQEGYSGFGTTYYRRIIAAHGSMIALADIELAGTGDVVVYDTVSGEKIFQTVYLGYDSNRVILFWANGKNYRLFLNGQGKPSKHPVIKTGGLYQRIESTVSDMMAIYLDENGEPYHRLSDNEMMDGIGKVVFSGSNDWFFNNKIPILEFSSAYPKEKYGESKFSVRNIYLLADGRVAVELEKDLIVIDLVDKHAEVVNDQKIIEQLIGSAKLLGADDENAHYYLNQCNSDKYTEAVSKEKDNTFVFCLK